MRVLKIFLKIAGVLVIVLLLAAGGLATYLRFAFPKVSPPDQTLKIEITPERVQRGDYLVNHVVDCFGCHGQKDFGAYGFATVPGTEGQGGFRIPREWKFVPGDITAPNITPYTLKDWTDGEIVRAIVSGVNRGGKVLFPMMPYAHYRELDREDIYSMVAYLRTLPSKAVDQRPTVVDFPLNLILRTVPKDPHYGRRPDASDTVASGEYLVAAAGCMLCHTVVNNKEEPTGIHFAGGREFDFPPVHGIIRSANITPDSATGIGAWSRETFIAVIRQRGALEASMTRVAPGDPNTLMPYGVFAGMTDADLGAVYAYLRTIAPVCNTVRRWEPKPL